MAQHFFPTIDEWSASKDKFRVVAGGFSRPFPLVPRVVSNKPLIEFHEAYVRPLLTIILKRHGITFSSIGMLRWLEPYFIDRIEEGPDLETLLIQTRCEDTSNWKNAAEEISRIYAHGGFGKDQIEVEIRNPSRMAWRTSDVLSDDADVLKACQSVRSDLIDETRAHCGSAWSSVAFHLRTHVGYNPGPKKPTVLVYCHKGSRCDFDALESALLRIISKAHVELCLELLPGSVTSAYSPLNKPKVLWNTSEEPFNGASIGFKGDTETAGTLGGWFMLNLPDSPPIKVALTSNNLFGNIDSCRRQQMDLTGLSLKQMTEIETLQVEYPAASDAMATIKELEALSLDPDCPSRNLQCLEKIRRAATAPPIGHVIATSGHRLNENSRRMDWAIIQVSGRMTENKPPPAAYLTELGYPRFGPAGYRVTPDSIIQETCEIRPGSWVVKNGKSTGVTSGKVNRLTRLVQWENQQESEEVDVVGLTKNFAQAGDSGSFVVDEDGNLVGLLIATDLITSCGLVTPMKELLADVKAMTGGYLTMK